MIKFTNVLSLFDGKSGGQLALNRAGIGYDNYFASEINPYAIKVTQHHFPNTIQLGSVTDINGHVLPRINLLLGGSPCQGFSFSGKQLNFNDPRSMLFFEFVRLLNETTPEYFLLENVVMKKEYQDIISKYLGVDPILLNSSKVSAQERERLYWTNIPNITQPVDKNIKLIDILETTEYPRKASIKGRRLNEFGKREDSNKELPMIQCLEVWDKNMDKSNCLTTVSKDNILTNLPIGRHLNAYKNKLPYRNYTIKELCRLQTLPEDYFNGIVSDSQAIKMIGNGWTTDIITHILTQINYEH